MSDLQFLFAVLGGLYLWECLGWLRRGSVAFTTWWGRSWRVQHPGRLLGNPHGGFTLAAGVPPLGTIWVAQQYPVSLGPAGVLFFVSPNVNPGWRAAQSARFLPWEDVPRLQWRGKKLFHQHTRLYTAATISGAQTLRQQLVNLAATPEAERAPRINEILRATLDSAAVRARCETWAKSTRGLRVATNLLFGWVFLVAPLLIAWLGLRGSWVLLVVGVVGLNGAIATGLARRHRQMYPDAAEERFTQTLLLALAPATAMRALDYLTRPWLEAFHPLAVAHQVLGPAEFRRHARRWLLDLHEPARPLCPSEAPAAVATEAFFRGQQQHVTATWLAEQGFAGAELTRPAPPNSAADRSYCPRCEAQFTTLAGTCADCGGVPLVPWTEPAA